MSIDYHRAKYQHRHPGTKKVMTFDALIFEGSGCCGEEFKAIAVVVQPDHKNPALLIKQPLGLNAVREILEAVENYKGMLDSPGE